MAFRVRALGNLLAGAALLCAAFGAAAQKTQLTVYTALETDQIKAYQTAFKKANPDIEIVWVRDSTGDRDRQAAGGEVQPEGRRRHGPGGDQPGDPRGGGHAGAVRAGRPESHRAAVP